MHPLQARKTQSLAALIRRCRAPIAWGVLLACSDQPVGPGNQSPVALSVAVELPAATPAVWYPGGDSLRVEVRQAGRVVPVVSFATRLPADAGPRVEATVVVPLSFAIERFVGTAEVDVGGQAYFLAFDAIQLRAGVDTAITLTARYVGPGALAVSMSLVAGDSALRRGDTTSVRGVAQDSLGQALGRVPLRFVSARPALLLVDSAGIARATDDAAYDTVRVTGYMPSGLSASAVLRVRAGIVGGPVTTERIAFISTQGGNRDLYIMNPDGSGARALTATPEDESNPAWSPDRQTIVVDRTVAGQGTQLIAVSTDGTGERVLTTAATSGGGTSSGARFSPDGSKIAFTRRVPSGASEIWVMAANGSGQRRLRDPGSTRDVFDDWAPDGKQILARFTNPGFLPSHPYLADSSGGGAREIDYFTESPAQVSAARWNPLGGALAFTRPAASTSLLEVALVGGNTFGLANHSPTFDGRLSYAASPDTFVFESEDGGVHGIYAAIRGGSATRLSPPAVEEFEPDFAPLTTPRYIDRLVVSPSPVNMTSDESSRTFTASAIDARGATVPVPVELRGAADSRTVPTATAGELVAVAPGTSWAVATYNGWRTDSAQITISTVPGSNAQILAVSYNYELYTLRGDGGALTRLTNNQVADYDPAFSPDGSKIAWTAYDATGQSDIKVMNADGSGAQALTANAYGDAQPTWSPDGRQIAWSAASASGGRHALWVMNANGSGARQLTTPPSGTEDVDPAWSPDGSLIAFARFSAGNATLLTVRPQGGPVQPLGIAARFPAWSPDGGSLLFTGSNFGSVVSRMTFPGGTPVALTTGSGTRSTSTAGDIFVAVASDGLIAFSSFRNNGGGAQAMVMRGDGSGQSGLIPIDGYSGPSSWRLTTPPRYAALVAIAGDTATPITAGATRTLTATAVDQLGGAMTPAGGFRWQSLDTLVATVVDSSGVVTGRAAGTARIVATTGVAVPDTTVVTVGAVVVVTSWNATTDFSKTSNPNGAWSSGWTATLGSAFVVYPTAVTGSGFDGWVDPAILNLGSPTYHKNNSASTVNGVAPGQVSLHPGCNANEYSELRWTAPSAGNYLANVQFLVGNSGNTDAAVLVNGGVPVFTAASTGGNPSYSSFRTLAAGDRIQFTVGTGGDGCLSDDTPLAVTILATNTVSLAANSITAQSATTGSPVGAPPSVIVRDGGNLPIPGVSVTFVVTAGGGSLTGATQMTDQNGVATVGSWTLGAVAGTNTVTASVPGVTPVSFDATGTAPIVATTRTWVGGDAAGPTSWFVAANWTPSGIPNAIDTVVIQAAASQPMLTADVAVTKLTVLGNGASLTMNGHTVRVAGPFVTGPNGGVVVMQQPSDSLLVGGSVTFAGDPTPGLLTAGVLTVGGDFSQFYIGSNWDAFAPSGTHLTMFTAGGAQNVHFDNPGTGAQTSFFRHLIAGQGGGDFQLTTDVAVTGRMRLTAGAVTGTDNLTVVDSLITAPGTTVSPTGVRLGGGMSIGGTFTPANTEFFGQGQVIQGGLGYQAVRVTGTATLGGTATFAGALGVGSTNVSGQQVAGDLNLGGHTLTVTGTFSTEPNGGTLTMQSTADTLLVAGNVTFAGAPTPGHLTAGLLSVQRNFTQTYIGSNWDAFAPSGSHHTRFNANRTQSVHFDNPGSGPQSSFFRHLDEEQEDGSLNLTTDAFATGRLHAPAGNIDGVGTLTVVDSLVTGPPTTVNPAGMRLGGGMLVEGVYNPANTEFFGVGQVIQGGLAYQNVRVTGTWTLGGNATFTGTLGVGSTNVSGQQVAGDLNLGGHALAVTGDFSTEPNGGTLTMQSAADTLAVGGNVLFAGAPTPGHLTAGVLSLQGNFTETYVGSNWDAFQPSGTHRTVFTGSFNQTVKFDAPGRGGQSSSFNDLELAQSAGRVFLGTNAFATGQLIARSPVAQVFGFGEHVLSVSGLNVVNTTMNADGRIESIGGVITRFDSVTFLNISINLAQLTIRHPGAAAPFTFRGVRFWSTPDSTGAYIDVTDTAPADGQPLSIILAGSDPLDGSAATRTSGGATVTWTSGAAAAAVTGTGPTGAAKPRPRERTP